MLDGHIVFFVSEDWYFCSHRLPVARAARDAGMRVTVVTQVDRHAERIAAEGFALVPFPMRRAGMNPWHELRLLWRLVAVYRRLQPDLVHQVAVKPVIYGSIAAWVTGVPAVVNALAGLGFVFASESWQARLLRWPVKALFKWALSRPGGRLILQNEDDAALFRQAGLAPSGAIRLIRGSGVDPQVYPALPPAPGVPVVMLPARLLRDKGVYEFVDAARLLRQRGIAARFALVGDPDRENPAAVSAEQCAAWVAEGVVEAWGWQSDMVAALGQSTLVCLPSYREGLPKSLLEAASCARAIVTTDVPGCREVVEDGVNGLLVPVRSVRPLADAIERLLQDSALRQRMAEQGRQRVLARYAESIVVRQTLAIYQELGGVDR
ncbi:glycosyltransferase family 4 protein [Chitiniphilus purpureus]|uniref:Glycosyltransferase family 4 protein n=1 Tax=Chitiniphilus purpureus TaxID=2981137 RepID=A0ABY6DRD2_9NEIS|nr:glycosyltransferase family 4 protein [Chitiniphilus sp. CD1]UXY14473.1 glycosyltransferase family 4 protein [Chitiniphilus sp. CD1]